MLDRLGISSWTYPWAIGVPGYPAPQQPMSACDLIRKTAQLGVNVLQIADNLPLHKMTDAEIDEVSRVAADSQITLEVGTRGVEPNHLLHYLEIAEKLDARIVRTLTHTVDSKPGVDQILQWLLEVLPSFEKAGVVIALENYEVHSARELRTLVEKVDSQFLGVCLDTVNNFGALESPSQVLSELAPFVVNLHIKEFQIQRVPYMMGYMVTGCPAGTGRLDVENLLRTLDGSARKINVILEQWPTYPGTVEESILQEASWAEQSVAYLKKVTGKYSKP